jgi:hypothetical protein
MVRPSPGVADCHWDTSGDGGAVCDARHPLADQGRVPGGLRVANGQPGFAPMRVSLHGSYSLLAWRRIGLRREYLHTWHVADRAHRTDLPGQDEGEVATNG